MSFRRCVLVNYKDEMKELRKYDSTFNEMVGIIEAKIQEKIREYYNTKTVKKERKIIHILSFFY